MAVYAIGDVQGCHRELMDLLDEISFDERRDRLWFAGDLVNKGPYSLAVLRFVRRLEAVTVLGNHDLHLLAIDAGTRKPGRHDTVGEILAAPDRKDLLDWLRRRPLLHHDEASGYAMLHAGLPPQWDLEQAKRLAGEVEDELRSGNPVEFFGNIYGNDPDRWRDELKGWDRLRYIVNACTRIRYCTAEGRLDFSEKGPPGSQPEAWQPWYSVAGRRTREHRIAFGHWASIYYGNLEGDFSRYNVYPLDTGCVWGRSLTAMRLEDRRFFQVPSRQPKE